MPRRKQEENKLFVPTVERTTKQNNSKNRKKSRKVKTTIEKGRNIHSSLVQHHQEKQMVEQNEPRRLLGDYAQHQGPRHFKNIVRPSKGVEIKFVVLSPITFNQFVGMKDEVLITTCPLFISCVVPWEYWGQMKKQFILDYFPFHWQEKQRTSCNLIIISV